MKHLYAVFILLLFATNCIGCPTCIGTIEPDSPPFFSKEFYQPNQNNEQTKTDDTEQEKEQQ